MALAGSITKIMADRQRRKDATMDKDFFEDFTVGETMTTPGRTITEADILAFAALTGDWHPIHTDPAKRPSARPSSMVF